MVLQNLGYTAVLLGVLVFVHELGHFLAAKALGVKVLRFSIGFGPRLFGFTRGETEYRIAVLPLGGYVKMAGEVPGEEVTPEEEARSYLAQSPWKRMLIVAAGPAFNLLFPLLVLFVVLASYPQTSTRVLSLEPGLPAAEAGVQLGDVITRVDGQPVRTFDQLRRAVEPKVGQRVQLTVERDGRPLNVVLTPSRAADGGQVRARGRIGVSAQARPPIIGVPVESPAARAGLHTFDRLVSVDGQPVTDLVALQRRLSAPNGAEVRVEAFRRTPVGIPGVDLGIPERIEVRVPRQPGSGLEALGVEGADLYVARVVEGSAAARAGVVAGDRLLAIDDQRLLSLEGFRQKLDQLREKPFRLTWLHDGQRREAEVRQLSVTHRDELSGQEITGLDLGLRSFIPSEAEKPQVDRVRVPPGEALVASVQKLGEVVAQTAGGLAMLLTGRLPFKSVGGPIMIYDITAKSAQAGLDAFLMLMALISVNLGLINLVPIPALDGFQLLSAGWEAVRRRPIPMRAREIANALGILALIVLMVLVWVNDLTR
jgi:regulator of sigma E protease